MYSVFQNTSETHDINNHHTLLTGTKQIWDKTKEALRKNIGEQEFKAWIIRLDICLQKNQEVSVCAPNVFIRNWVRTHYGEQIRKYWKQFTKEYYKSYKVTKSEMLEQNMNIAFSVRNSQDKPDPLKSSQKKAHQDDIKQPVSSSGYNRQKEESSIIGSSSALGSSLQKAMTFDTFIVGEANEVACAVARRVARGGDNGFNPVYIYGVYGCGKTHLLNAIAHEANRLNLERRCLYMTAERFLNSFIKAIRFGNISLFKDQLRNVDLFLLDDIHMLSGKTSTQEEFMHTLVALLDRGHQVVLTADRSAAALESVDNRLKSYLSGGLSCDVNKPDLDLRRKMLNSRIEMLSVGAYPGLNIPESVRDFLASRIVGSPRELFGVLNRIIAKTAMLGREVTLQATKESLSDYIRTEHKRITVDEIQKTVAEYYTLCMTDLLSSRRVRSVARPRQIAMYLAKILTTRSLPDLGRRFGGRDHTTVIHAIRKIESLMESDEAILADIDQLKARLMKP